jgi:hypothetical protein
VGELKLRRLLRSFVLKTNKILVITLYGLLLFTDFQEQLTFLHMQSVVDREGSGTRFCGSLTLRDLVVP